MTDNPITTTETGPVDWRGTPITPGALVIYGGPAGRSITMVEAIVADPMLSPSGRIWLNVIRRSYAHTDGAKVHVGADRLTVVTGLPPTTVPTEAERHEAEERKRAAREVYVTAAHETEQHGGEPWGAYQDRDLGPDRWGRPQPPWQEYMPCERCRAANVRFGELWEAGEIT
jgi:hypothetical protein